MEDFRIWGRIEQTMPNEFVVIVTAVPETTDPAGVRTLTTTWESREDAVAGLRAMVVRMGQAVRSADGRVTDTEVDGL